MRSTIRCTLDLRMAYDDVPSHVSWRLMRPHSFVRSSHKAEAGEAPLGTQWSYGKNSAGFSVSSNCLRFLEKELVTLPLTREYPSSFAVRQMPCVSYRLRVTPLVTCHIKQRLTASCVTDLSV